MTIHEHDRVSADRGGGQAHTTHALVDRPMAGEPYAVAFVAGALEPEESPATDRNRSWATLVG